MFSWHESRYVARDGQLAINAGRIQVRDAMRRLTAMAVVRALAGLSVPGCREFDGTPVAPTATLIVTPIAPTAVPVAAETLSPAEPSSQAGPPVPTPALP